jgi:HlyD family secretion protein
MKSALICAAALCALTACSQPNSKPVATAPAHRDMTATVTTVSSGTLTGQFTLSGTQVSREEAAVSTELSGYRVAQVLVEAGATVTAGQPLAMLDDTLLKDQIEQQEAVVAQQQVAYDKAQQEASRVANLDKQGVLSTESVNERALAAQSAKAALGQAKAVLDDDQVRLGLMIVRAPVAGRVLTRAVRPGDIASPSAVMFTLARDGLVELEALVPEAEQASIKIGAPAQVTLPGGKELAGQVRLVSPNVDSDTKLGTVRIALPSDPDLKPGGFGQASIGGATRIANLVPASAVSYDADGASIFVVGNDNILRRQVVRTGAISGDRIELVQGPPAGTAIVAKGAALLLPGDHVNPVKLVAEN